MPGIQISGLLANSAFDWKSVVDQLVAASGIPVRNLEREKTANTAKIDALAQLGTLLTSLQDAVQTMRSTEVFDARTVSSDLASTTWKSSSVTGAAVGSYAFDVTQVATAAQWRGAADIGAGLSGSSDVSHLTLATLATATPIKAGTFTVDGQQINVALTDSLQEVFDAIATATGGAVTASYDPAADRISLSKQSGTLILGAANDTSNFLSVMKLSNTGTSAAVSGASLGAVSASAPLASANLRRPITGLDAEGNGAFKVNGVAVSYNIHNDSLGALLARINQAGAGVTASYDSANDRVVLANKETGDTGVGLQEVSGDLLAALGLSGDAGGVLVRGKNAAFTVNGGSVFTSQSNTLEASVHGIAGLSVTVNTATRQTLQVESDTATMQRAIEDFIGKFNAVQEFIDESTRITVTGTTVTAAVLANNREIQAWGSRLRSLAFDSVAGLTGRFTRLDHLGIDFNGSSGRLQVKDSGKLAAALGDRPEDVKALFLAPTSGLIARFYDYVGTISAADRKLQSSLSAVNLGLDQQIARLNARLESERESLTTAFIRMLDAQSVAQTQSTYLTNTYFKNNANS